MGVSAAVDTIGSAVADAGAAAVADTAASSIVPGILTTAGGVGTASTAAELAAATGGYVGATGLSGALGSLGSLATPSNILTAGNLGSSLINANAAQNAANIQAQAAQGQQRSEEHTSELQSH